MATATREVAVAPRPLSLIHGELDPCLLVTPAEVESVAGGQVITELRFPMVGATSRKYAAALDDQPIFFVLAFTNANLRKFHETYPAAEMHEMTKKADPNLQKQISEIEIGDLANLEDQAYFQEGASLVFIRVLKKESYDAFGTRTIDAGGIGFEGLMKLAQIAIPRMPVSDISDKLSDPSVSDKSS